MSRTQPAYKRHTRNPELWLKDKKVKKFNGMLNSSQGAVNYLLNAYVENRTRLKANLSLTIGKTHL